MDVSQDVMIEIDVSKADLDIALGHYPFKSRRLKL
jgi:hypothetical protein